MRSGLLDRRITIQRKSITQSDSGEEVVAWIDVAEVWAGLSRQPGSESFALQQFVGKSKVSFRVRWSDTAKATTVEDRVLYRGREHEIVDVSEGPGRDESLILDCTVASEQPVAS
jgi:SPP1 family predicted phage head-tail adaptor